MTMPNFPSMPVKFRLQHASGIEVVPLWLALATLRKHGFRTLAPVVRSGLAGSWLLATAVYQGKQAGLSAASMLRVVEELEQESLTC